MENWCEYVSRDGEVRNVLQFFCECEDLDETFTNLVSSNSASNTGTPGGWKRVLAVAQDRARVPWPGGARRVNLSWFLAAALLWLLRFAARRSGTIVQVVLVVATCFGLLGYSHLMALRRRSSSQFHVAWLTLSMLGLYARHRESVRRYSPPVLSRTTDLMVHFCFLVMVACYAHCCLADPGRIEATAATTAEGGLAPSLSSPPLIGQRGDAADSDVAGGAGLYPGTDGDAKPLLREREQQQRQHHRQQREAQRQQRQRHQQHQQQQPSTLLRSGRCSICRSTFRLRDHHCVWIGQCVAERNRRSFLAFLVLLAGLSLWFSRRTMALTELGRRAPRCWGKTCLTFSARAFAGLLWRSYRRCGACSISGKVLGSEDVAVGLYALVAGFLAAALAAQQILLISAGVTTAELRRRRKPRVPSTPPDDELCSSAACSGGTDPSQSLEPHGLLGVVRPPTFRAVLPPPSSAAARKKATPSRRRSSFFSSLSPRGIVGNWARFLAGTELPPSATAPRVSHGRSAAAAGTAVVGVSPIQGEGHTPPKDDAAVMAGAVEPAVRSRRDRGKLS